MGDKSSFLSLAVSDFGTQDPYFTHSSNGTVLMHADESLPPTSSPPVPLHDASRGQQSVGADSPLGAGPSATQDASLLQRNLVSHSGREAENQPALHTFFAAHPDRAAAAVSPEDEDALTQRRWRADAAEVETYLTQLDLAREECAAAGLYAKAQACMQRMKQAVHLFAKRLHAETDAVAARTQARVAAQQKRERLDLRKAWQDRIAAYRRDATALVAAAQQHHYAQLEKEDVAMRAELRRAGVSAEESCDDGGGGCGGGSGADSERCHRRAVEAASPSPAGPSWSKEVQHLQVELQQCLRQRRYREAERVRAQLQRLERQESADHQRGVTQRHVLRLQALKAAQAAELAEMQAEQRQEAQEMTVAARAALEDLTQRHLAVLQTLEERRQHVHTKTREVLQAYKHADVLDPRATGLKLIRLSQLLWTPLSNARR